MLLLNPMRHHEAAIVQLHTVGRVSCWQRQEGEDEFTYSMSLQCY